MSEMSFCTTFYFLFLDLHLSVNHRHLYKCRQLSVLPCLCPSPHHAYADKHCVIDSNSFAHEEI